MRSRKSDIGMNINGMIVGCNIEMTYGVGNMENATMMKHNSMAMMSGIMTSADTGEKLVLNLLFARKIGLNRALLRLEA